MSTFLVTSCPMCGAIAEKVRLPTMSKTHITLSHYKGGSEKVTHSWTVYEDEVMTNAEESSS